MNEDELKVWRDEINKTSKVKPWLIVYDRIESPTTIEITDKQKKLVDEAVNRHNETGKIQNLELKDGVRFNTNFRVLIKNPNWRSPEDLVKKIVFYRYQRDFSERRLKGEDITWEKYASTKKEEAQKISQQLKEAIEND